MVYTKVPIYYATESGTAQNFAYTLADDARALKIPTKVMDVKDLSTEQLKNDKFAVFLMSTHFEGDPPTNAEKFNKWFVKAKKSNDDDSENYFTLENLKYSIYGLGDITYTYYNKFATDVDVALEKRGASRINGLVLGSNHENNITDHFMENFREGFWAGVKSHIPMKAYDPNEKDDFEEIDENLPSYKFICDFEIQENGVNNSDHQEEEKNKTAEPPLKLEDYEIHTGYVLSAHKAEVVEMRDLRQKNTETGRTIHIEMNLPEGVTYETASNLILYPENCEENVDLVLKNVLELNGDEKFSLRLNKRFSGNIKKPFPSPITVREYLTRWIDLQGVLKKTTLKN